ncbi:BV2 protein [Tomato yellow leaf curl Thailand virus]|uniref:BV2 protein n=1 Tax=Tomato yellow leaf curl Thailand virus TaxID=85752 RepID=Q9WPG6_9GEMI|nr:BV2 protein [Tomato yellow leaf curl Thailand virus]AAD39159.1 BV2 protein [Tomato yellow leaf curl Thailand virus-[2]]
MSVIIIPTPITLAGGLATVYMECPLVVPPLSGDQLEVQFGGIYFPTSLLQVTRAVKLLRKCMMVLTIFLVITLRRCRILVILLLVGRNLVTVLTHLSRFWDLMFLVQLL